MVLSLLALAFATLSFAQEAPAPFQPDALRLDLEYLSCDAFQGRKSGEFGGKAAGRWLQTRFQALGLQPVGDSWLHPFASSPLFISSQTFLSIGEKTFSAGKDFLPHPSSPEGLATGELVFAGYALQSDHPAWDDFAGISLEGKFALILRWEPQAEQPDSLFLGKELLPASRLAAKVWACEQRGAIGVLVADAPGPSAGTSAAGAPFWPAHSEIFQRVLPGLGQMMPPEELAATNFNTTDVANQLFGMMQGAGPLGSSIPVAYLSPRMARALFNKAANNLTAWVKQTNQTLQPDSFPIPVSIHLQVDFDPPSREGRNLVAALPGTAGETQNEVVLITAHYDHVGMGKSGEVWNGADDNGSGATALLALAKYFVHHPQPRTLVFCAFDGEELGLLGANRFLGQGLVSAKNIHAMLNIDMIGRAKDHTVSVVGTKSADGLRELAEQAKGDLPLTLDFNAEEFFDRSDQAPFYFEGIPILFLNTAEHEDYHTPNDDADRVLYEDMSLICQLAARMTVGLAHQDALIFQDGYNRRRSGYGMPPNSMVPWPIPFHQRMEY